MSESENLNSASDGQAQQPIALQVGSMTPEQIALIFTHLPVDVTFVDEGNDVRFYSGGPTGYSSARRILLGGMC